MDSKQYWDKKIIDWENSMKKGTSVSPIEKLAGYFRKPLLRRMVIATDIVALFAKDKTVFELGCGSGFFAFGIQERAGTRHITGVDISPQAISRARLLAADRGQSGAFTFIEGDALLLSFPAADITVGLGFLDYLNLAEVEILFRKMTTPYFLFSFSEKKVSLLRYIHILYMFSQRCPKHFYFTKKEVTGCIGSGHGKIHFINDKRSSFSCLVHNFPVDL